MHSTGLLSVVATPIGNLEDITLRAIRILNDADYILAEDTRVTGNLCKRHDITTPLKRYDAHASEQVHEQILTDLKEGKHIALVGDAGTPGISDPGVLLVRRARSAGVSVEAIPGPSALTAAFSIAGIVGNAFTFLGFVPQKKGRKTFFEALTTYSHPVIFFESTHRILKTLQSLQDVSADTSLDWNITVARELTKLHEEVVVGTPKEVLAYFETEPVKQKGEFVVLVDVKNNTNKADAQA